MADCLNPLRKISKKTFELDVAHYFTLPEYAYCVMLKKTGFQLELLSIVDMLQMVWEGITVSLHRYAKANNPYLENYEESKLSNYLMYLDIW